MDVWDGWCWDELRVLNGGGDDVWECRWRDVER